MANRGRPTKLNENIHRKIVDSIRLGNYIETAAAFSGVSKTSVYEWMKRGARELERLENNPRAKMRKSEEIYCRFVLDIEKAQAEAEMRDLNIIGKASEHDWKASAWRLERKYGHRWGRKDRLEAEVEHSGEVKEKKETHVTIRQLIEADPQAKELAMALWRKQFETDLDRDEH